MRRNKTVQEKLVTLTQLNELGYHSRGGIQVDESYEVLELADEDGFVPDFCFHTFVGKKRGRILPYSFREWVRREAADE